MEGIRAQKMRVRNEGAVGLEHGRCILVMRTSTASQQKFSILCMSSFQTHCLSLSISFALLFAFVSRVPVPGKTVILELAILRFIKSGIAGKVVYQAPTKSLCSERHRDWSDKFRTLGLTCAELTGDSDAFSQRDVANADIIITTPEKWDSVTRKWHDHKKLMTLVELMLIDEVHILKDDRGACLEAVVSRMKSAGGDVRFVALSATIPNAEDVASWLGRAHDRQHEPARCEVFGEGFRPVRLERKVIGFNAGGNDFAFDKQLDEQKITEATAGLLSDMWKNTRPQDRPWDGPSKPPAVQDTGLQTSVAFHHAGLNATDRAVIEKSYLDGSTKVICCTSTLAVGVNLPCHMVVIKNTVGYQDAGPKEYSDLEIMQMLGRAGRPQFDRSAVAIILTRMEKVAKYEKMTSGQEVLESRMLRVGLGTIHNKQSARSWLESTFLHVRYRRNPSHYGFEGDRGIIEAVDASIGLLDDHDLVTNGSSLRSTGFGEAMARYCVQFESMKLLMGVNVKAKISEILAALAQAVEFKSIRFRAGEKPMFKEINSSPFMKFPIKVDLALPAHKVSLIVQAALGSITVHSDKRYAVHRQQYLIDQGFIFQHIHRLVRCYIDCQLHLEDSVAARNALELARSLGCAGMGRLSTAAHAARRHWTCCCSQARRCWCADNRRP
ncbi:hypothetical protein MRB53_037311 [Persea americana]|nr:hypothetical protein MRB53_037311 [Persea americana]